MAVYPTALVTTTDIPSAGANLSTNPHSSLHDEMRDEIVAIEAELGVAPSSSYATVAARLNAGWQPIMSGAPSAVSSFTITIPASTYEMVRVHVFGVIASGLEPFFARVNGDSTAALHEYNFNSGSATPSTTGNVLQTTGWRLGTVSSTSNGVYELTVHAVTTGGSYSALCPFVCYSSNYSATPANAQTFISGGKLSTARTLSSLVLFPNASTFTGRYICEGYVVP